MTLYFIYDGNDGVLMVQLGDSMVEFGMTKATERLTRLVYRSNSDVELQKEEKQWWKEFPSENWEF